jgi:propanol-preferring alcohol dehydrogenase
MEIPPERKGYEIIKVASCGMCRTDIHIVDGMYSDLKLPLILGHEISGFTTSGKPALIYGAVGCGKCHYCKKGESQLCEYPSDLGINVNGGFAQYVSVPSSNIIVLEGMDPYSMSVLSDAGVTAYRAVKKIKNFTGIGANILVLGGTGGVGQFIIQLLKIILESKVTVVSRSKEKLKSALDIGADFAKTYSDNIGYYDAVIDVVGTSDTLDFGNKHLYKDGVLVLVGEEGGQIEFGNTDVHHGEKIFMSTLWGTKTDLIDVAKIAQNNLLKWKTKSYSLENINDAMYDLRTGTFEGRILISPFIK